MANQEQLEILKQGVDVWNKWREENPETEINLSGAHLREANLTGANLTKAILSRSTLSSAILKDANFTEADLSDAHLQNANLFRARLGQANLRWAILKKANLSMAILTEADLSVADFNAANMTGVNFGQAILNETYLGNADLSWAKLTDAIFKTSVLEKTNLFDTTIGHTSFLNIDLSNVLNLETVRHNAPSYMEINTLSKSRGKIPEVFLRGCGLSDWEIESVKLYNPDLGNNEFIDIQNRIFDLRKRQALQISPLFISYSHADSSFVDKIEVYLNKKGIRFWRDIHDAKAGRLEKQIDRAMHLNPTVLLILSEHSLQSDWVEHEVRTARALEKEMRKDVLCPVALDDSWKNSPWSKRVMEQVMENNILDFSAWKDDGKFGIIFNKLIDGLELFYK